MRNSPDKEFKKQKNDFFKLALEAELLTFEKHVAFASLLCGKNEATCPVWEELKLVKWFYSNIWQCNVNTPVALTAHLTDVKVVLNTFTYRLA